MSWPNEGCLEITKHIRRHQKRKDWQRCLCVLSDAHCAFVQLDVVAYGSGVSPPRWREAQRLLLGLQDRRLKADVIVYNQSISCCEKATAWLAAVGFLRHLQQELSPDLISDNSCLSSFPWLQAMRHWRTMQQVDLISYDALMTSQKGDRWPQCLDLLLLLPNASLRPEALTFNVAISAMRNDWKRALSLFAIATHRTMVTFNAVTTALEEHWQRSLRLLQQSESDGLQASSVTYGSILSACEGRWSVARHALEELMQRRVQNNLIIMNACMSACEKCSQWQLVMSLFDGLQGASQADEISYTAAYTALQQGGWPRALQLVSSESLEAAVGQEFPWRVSSQLLQQLQLSFGRPSPLSSTCVLSSMTNSRAPWSRAMAAFAENESCNLILSNAAMVCNARISQWRGVLQLLGRTRDATSYQEATASCERGGQSFSGLCLLSELQTWALDRMASGAK